jgi:translation initiation factor IF-1
VAALGAQVWRVELANGHRLAARILRRDRARAPALGIGSRVQVAVSPADLSNGVLVLNAEAVK